MKTKFYIENPDNIEATINITMTLKDWKFLRQQLIGNYPSWKLSDAILEVVNAAEKEFYAKEQDQEGI